MIPDQTTTADARKRYVLYAVGGSVGAATMGAELGAARLVAPFFGTSTMVWALVIGATLLSLSIGQLIGGWLSARGATEKTAARLLLISAAVLAVLPFVGRPLMAQTLQLFYTEAYGTIVASALSVTLLTGLPLISMGAVGPLLLQLSITDARKAGQIGSYLYAWGTIGSLVGTYASGLIFIPLLGTTQTLWLFAALLAVTSAFISNSARQNQKNGIKTAVSVLLPIALLITTLALPKPAIKNLPGQIFEAETAHNYIAVLQKDDERQMVFNDGFAVQSIYRENELPLKGVWGYYALSPAWTKSGKPKNILMLGLGGGTAARQFRELYPEAKITGVELDAGAVQVGQKYMGMPTDINVVIEDARTFLWFDKAKYDVILIDAFQFPYVPFQVTTREFFTLVESHLEDGGAVLLNVGRAGKHRDVVHALVHTAQTVFPTVNAVDVHETYNTIIYAGRHELKDSTGLDALNLRPHTHGWLSMLPNPEPWPTPPNTPILTDDRAPVEWLTDLIVLRHIFANFFPTKS